MIVETERGLRPLFPFDPHPLKDRMTMPVPDDFIKAMTDGYTFSGATITLGAPLLNGECPSGVHVKVPLRTMNRHGLIAGATGTGKTKHCRR
jgi:DNA helicase HerA-like ATPase